MSVQIDNAERLRRTDIATALVAAEVNQITARFAPFNSTHEGYAVILEELDEVFADVKRNDRDAAVREAVQVAATAIRFITDLGSEELFAPPAPVVEATKPSASMQGSTQATLGNAWVAEAVQSPTKVPEVAVEAPVVPADTVIDVAAEVVEPDTSTPAKPIASAAKPTKFSGLQGLLSSVNRK